MFSLLSRFFGRPEKPYVPLIAMFSAKGRFVLVPSARLRKTIRWSNPDRAVVIETDRDPVALGQAVAEAIARASSDTMDRKPPRNKHDVIDKPTHDLVGYQGAKGFFGRVAYGQILPKEEEEVVFRPSHRGAVMSYLPEFRARLDDPRALGEALMATLEACRLSR